MKLQKLSLFGAVAGALILTAAFAPRANAALIVYYNFEDSTLGGPPDFTSTGDLGLQHPTMTTNYNAANMTSVAGLALNRPATDPDPNLLGLGLSKSKNNDPSFFQFTVDTTLATNMSLSFGVNNNGNGFSTVAFSYSINGGTSFVADGSHTILNSSSVVTFAVPAGADGQASVIMRLTFSGGQSNGTDLQTQIDNVQLNGTVVPEPATVVGGLLGACALCWHQRRRLIRSLRLRRA